MKFVVAGGVHDGDFFNEGVGEDRGGGVEGLLVGLVEDVLQANRALDLSVGLVGSDFCFVVEVVGLESFGDEESGAESGLEVEQDDLGGERGT